MGFRVWGLGFRVFRGFLAAERLVVVLLNVRRLLDPALAELLPVRR